MTLTRQQMEDEVRKAVMSEVQRLIPHRFSGYLSNGDHWSLTATIDVDVSLTLVFDQKDYWEHEL